MSNDEKLSDALPHLSRLSLARLGREIMTAAQFNSRTGYAALRINHGDAAYKDTAIDNWIAASPVYTRRMQNAMGFAGSDVATIFKGLQLECGFSHQYFNAHFEVESPDRGRFWLESCGALLEAEPRGPEAVQVMCHDIEDPTFDATAVATNPRARMRPVHRPPRMPAHREPHCEWLVTIDADAEPLAMHRLTQRMAETVLAQLSIMPPAGLASGGMEAYDGPVLEVFALERLSHTALVVVVKELAIQHHLLINSLLMVVAQRYGDAAARAVAEFQMTGSAAVMSERLARSHTQGLQGIDAAIAVLNVHPAFLPREYIGLQIERLSDTQLRLAFADCPAAHENLPHSWYALLAEGVEGPLEALVAGISPQLTLSREAGRPMAWLVEEGADAAAASDEPPLAVQVARGTVLYRTELADHIPLLELR